MLIVLEFAQENITLMYTNRGVEHLGTVFGSRGDRHSSLAPIKLVRR